MSQFFRSRARYFSAPSLTCVVMLACGPMADAPRVRVPSPRSPPVVQVTHSADYYVAQNGNDDGPGTLDRPFETIGKAASVVKAGQTVLVRQGTYRETVRPALSGEAGKPIVLAAYPGEQVVLSGTERLEDLQREADGILVGKCPSFPSRNNQALQLFANGRMLFESRHPDVADDVVRAPMLEVDKVLKVEKLQEVKYRTTFAASAFQEPKGKWDGAQISIRPMWNYGWGMQRTGSIISSEPGRLVVDLDNYEWEEPSKGNATVIREGSPFFVFGGGAQTLDAHGEWVCDSATGTLRIKLPQGMNEETSIEAKARDWAFDLSERSHVTLKGFEIFGASITTDVDSGTGIGERYPDHQIRLDVAPSHHIVIDGIRGRYVTHFTKLDGYPLSQWANNSGIVLSGSEHVLQNSVIEFSAGNGVSMLGRRHLVVNNIIHHFGYSGAEVGGVGTGVFKTPSEDHQIAHNTIYTGGGNGVHLTMTSTTAETPARLHHNVISDVGLQRVDIGFVYSSGAHEHAVHLDHNLMFSNTSSQGYGIYLDYGTNWIIHHNVVTDVSWAACVHANEQNGHKLLWYNNTLLGFGHSMQGIVHGKTQGIEVRNSILIPRYDRSAQTLLSHNYNQNDRGGLAQLFVAPERFDFRPKPGARKLLDRGEPLGQITAGFTGSAPDIGALEAGAELPRYGSDLQPHAAPAEALQVQSGEPSSALLTWSIGKGRPARFIVERGRFLDMNFLYHVGWETRGELEHGATRFVDRDVPAEGPTLYRVRAVEGLPSNIAWYSASDSGAAQASK